MKRMLLPIMVLMAMPLGGADPAMSRSSSGENTSATTAEITSHLGLVPTFFKSLPPEALEPAWLEFKGLFLEPTSLSPVDRELIGLAVASQVPCEYCTYLHAKFATFGGATDRQQKEAILMAGITRQWSTVLNGSLQDEAEFRVEMDRMFRYAKDMMDRRIVPPSMDVTNAITAMADIRSRLGTVPAFLRHFPETALAGAWLEMRDIQMNPDTALSPKMKELVGTAVAAQIPCRYCLYFHREAARMNGATDREIDEAIAISGVVRHWSAYLNGTQMDMKTFRMETDRMVEYARQARMRGSQR